MNIYQRIVLIVGAIILIVVIWTCPKMITGDMGHLYKVGMVGNTEMFAEITEINSAIARSIGVIGAILLTFFALKDIGKKDK
jgi:hypothetical protein